MMRNLMARKESEDNKYSYSYSYGYGDYYQRCFLRIFIICFLLFPIFCLINLFFSQICLLLFLLPIHTCDRIEIKTMIPYLFEFLLTFSRAVSYM